jgi:predicted dehydrogenase
MSTVRLGIIGIGTIGSFHISNIKQLSNCKLTAICDIDPAALERHKENAGDAAHFNTSEELLDSGLVDGVIIATPHYFHVPIAMEAIKRGIHVLVEKPIAVQKSQAEEFVKLCKENPKIIASAMFCLRRMPANMKLKSLIDSGELGTIRRINWIITNWFRTQKYYDSGTWRATWSGEGGGVLLNQCPHQLDLMQWFFGMPEKITASVFFGKYHDIEVEDEVSAIFEYADGKTAIFVTSTGEAPGTNRLEIAAERGKVILENDTLYFYRNEEEMSQFCKNSDVFMGMPTVWDIKVPIGTIDHASHRDIIENFADAIANGTPLYAPAVEGINSLELANAMLMSGTLQQSVKLPIDSGKFDEILNNFIKNSTRKG